MAFSTLNIISGYSFLKSGLTIDRIKQGLLKNNLSGAALADFNLHGAPFFINMMEEINLPYLIGEKIKLSHYIFGVYVLNEDGYKALCKISSFDDEEDILKTLKEYKDDLLYILETCGDPFLADLEANTEAFRKELLDLSKLSKYFYLGVQIAKKEDIEVVNKIREFANKYTYTTIAYPKIQYLKKADAITLKIVHAIDNDETLEEKEQEGPNFFCKDQVYRKLYTKEECDLTNEVLKLSTFDFHKKRGELLHFVKDNEALLKEKCLEGLKNKKLEKEEYLKRMNYELDIIISLGYASYFLIVQDYVIASRNKGILVGPGRGSVTGSLVAYLLDITEIDPLKHGLIFERFLNPARKQMPDIDMDFMDTRREEVIEYLKERYGSEKVAKIVTFSTILAKQSLRDIGRIYEIPTKDIDILAKRILSAKTNLRDSYRQYESFRKLVDSDKYYLNIVSLASKIESLPRQSGLHASGVVLNDQDISNIMPISKDFEGNQITQYEMHFLEEQGFLKMDILGLRNLTIISDCVDLINKNYPDLHLDKFNIPYEEKECFELISSRCNMGIFQLESSGMNNAIKTLKPSNFNDVAALLALFRPGPMAHIPNYARRKEGLEKVTYPTPDLEPILKETYGIIVYQEQVLQIAQVFAGFSVFEADIFRKAVSKKELKTLKEQESKFLEGAKRLNRDPYVAKSLFNDILKFANYGFNKSHSVGYALIACRMAYLKYHYPLEFYASILKTSSGTNDVKFNEYISEMKRFNIKLIAPSINHSELEFNKYKDGLLFPLTSIKGINAQSAYEIITERENKGEFKDFVDFVVRMYPYKISVNTINKLIDAGALDEFNYSRSSLLAAINGVMQYSSLIYNENMELQLVIDDIKKPRIPLIPDDNLEKLEKEMDALGIMISDNPLKYLRSEIKDDDLTYISSIEDNVTCKVALIIKSSKQIKTRKGDMMAFVKGYDETGELEIVLFPKTYQESLDLLKKNNMVVVKGRLDTSRESESFLVDEISPLLLKEENNE